MKTMRVGAFACTVALCFGTAAFGDDAVKPLAGTWTAQADTGGDAATTWVISRKGDAVKIAEMKGTEKLSEVECNTMGRECQFKEDGKKATVSMWFNGPKLVELETKGSDVVKRRFGVNEKGDAMDVEITPISENGKPEVVHFKRVEVTARGQ
jgi:hypothetical protein